MKAAQTIVGIALNDLREFLPDWKRRLKAEGHPESTIKSYLSIANDFVTFLLEHGMPTTAPEVGREYVEAYLAYMTDRPNKRTGKPLAPATVAKHYRSLQQLFKWLDEVEGEIDQTPFARMSPPAVPEQPVDVITDEQLVALFATCQGRTFENRRDEAILRLFVDSGARIGEVGESLMLNDLDFDMDVAHVEGKGRRARSVPFGAKTGETLRRYIRMRARHKFADRPNLWLGRQGPLRDGGIRRIVDRRATDAGLPHLYPHQFRHTFAHRWLADGGQEQDLMRLTGWRSREMVARYGASVADERAREQHRRRGLGDRL